MGHVRMVDQITGETQWTAFRSVSCPSSLSIVPREYELIDEGYPISMKDMSLWR